MLQSALSGLVLFTQIITDVPYGGDFSIFWETGQYLVQGNLSAIYDLSELKRAYEKQGSVFPFPYPPSFLMFVFPLGYLTYAQAFAAWSLVLSALYGVLVVALLKKHLPREQMSAYITACVCVVPFFSVSVLSGQTGMLIAVLLLAAIYFWDDYPIFAGICIGCMTIKPQFGVLLPFALIAAGKWRTIAAATVTALALMAAVTFWLGTPIWQYFFNMINGFSAYVGHGVLRFDWFALGPYIALRGAGVMVEIAFVCQSVLTAGTIYWVMRAFNNKNAPKDLQCAILACGCLLATPYAMLYDMPLIAAAIIPLFVRNWLTGWNDWLEIVSFGAVLTAPFVHPVVMAYHVPFGFISMLLFFTVLCRRCDIELQTGTTASNGLTEKRLV